MTKHKKIICPYCGSEYIAEYIHGMPAFYEELMKDIDDGKVILAGCLIRDNDPDYRCRDCGKDFGGNLKKMSVTEDEVLRFAKENEFEGIKYKGAYEGFHVYEALFTTDPNVILDVGFPQFILVKGNQIDFANVRIIGDIMNNFASEEDDGDEEEITENCKR